MIFDCLLSVCVCEHKAVLSTSGYILTPASESVLSHLIPEEVMPNGCERLNCTFSEN